jgi:hypothetical protein
MNSSDDIGLFRIGARGGLKNVNYRGRSCACPFQYPVPKGDRKSCPYKDRMIFDFFNTPQDRPWQEFM